MDSLRTNRLFINTPLFSSNESITNQAESHIYSAKYWFITKFPKVVLAIQGLGNHDYLE